MFDQISPSATAAASAPNVDSQFQLFFNELTAERDQFKVLLDKANSDISALQAKLLFNNEMLRENSAVTLHPSCVNCGEAHSANFRGSKVYKQFISKRQKQVPMIDRETKKAAYNNFTTSDVSYAAAVGNQRNPHRQQSSGLPNCLEFIEAERNEQFGINFTELIKKTAVFVPKYITLKPKAKQMALLKFIMSITPNFSA